ncbi:MAG: hypothetical protein SGILL_006142 [Bacillariaceae sp.]
MALAILGTIVDTPEFGSIRGLEARTLVVVDKDGIIQERLDDDADNDAGALQRRVEKLERDDNVEILRLGEREYLIPGFIDSHVHASQWPFAGTGVDRPLMAQDGFLLKHAFPTEGMFQDKAVAKMWYGSFLDEMIKQGTTTAVIHLTSHRQACNVLVDLAVERRGPRCYVGKVNMDTFHPHPEGTKESLDETEAFIARTLQIGKANHNLVIPVVTPRFIPTCSKDLLKGLGGLAKQYDIPTQTHMSETIDELDFSRNIYPDKTDAEVLLEVGILKSPSIMAHCTHMVQGEKELMKKVGAAVSHCPMSNFFFAKEALPVRQLIQKDGVVVTLSTDVAGGYHPSMLNAMRTAVLASKTLQFKRDVRSIFPQNNPDQASVTEDELRERHDLTHFDALYLATAAGAKALARSDIGVFDVGCQLDAVVLGADPTVQRFDGGTAESRQDVFQKILCLGDDRNVKRVFVRGVQLK